MNQIKISERKAVGTSLLVSISDVSLNLIVGLLTGSVVVISQSLQGFSDLVTAGILYRGVSVADTKVTSKYPFGRGRELFFYVLVAGILMFAGTGVASVAVGINKIAHPSDVNNLPIALAMLSFGLITNAYSFNVSRKRLGLSKINNKSLKKLFRSSMVETKATLIIDFLGTLAAAMGLIALGLLLATDIQVFDAIGSIIIGVIMMCAAALLMYDAKSLIVGRAADKDTTAKIIQSVEEVDGVIEILDLKTMVLGSGKLMAVIEAHFKEDLTVAEIEKKNDKIKLLVKSQVPQVHVVQVEAETPDEELQG